MFIIYLFVYSNAIQWMFFNNRYRRSFFIELIANKILLDKIEKMNYIYILKFFLKNNVKKQYIDIIIFGFI